uniref:Uncharacterized protein n=1 Tax=Mycobacterium riyadhense TaxID=486698 RepID=A0A653EE10_9MYCO|nr:hypothetical protein BIN_B_01190 [Mycobacterium riyadhense]
MRARRSGGLGNLSAPQTRDGFICGKVEFDLPAGQWSRARIGDRVTGHKAAVPLRPHRIGRPHPGSAAGGPATRGAAAGVTAARATSTGAAATGVTTASAATTGTAATGVTATRATTTGAAVTSVTATRATTTGTAATGAAAVAGTVELREGLRELIGGLRHPAAIGPDDTQLAGGVPRD